MYSPRWPRRGPWTSDNASRHEFQNVEMRNRTTPTYSLLADLHLRPGVFKTKRLHHPHKHPWILSEFVVVRVFFSFGSKESMQAKEQPSISPNPTGPITLHLPSVGVYIAGMRTSEDWKSIIKVHCFLRWFRNRATFGLAPGTLGHGVTPRSAASNHP